MTVEERNRIINEHGEKLAKSLGKFYGNVQLNIQNGSYVNCNVNESIKPERQK